MKLYGSLASPYVARVVMFANLKHVDLPMEPAPGGMGSDEYKLINPTGKIPALKVAAGTIAESTVICEYIESMYPQIPLLPADPFRKAQTRMVAHMTDLYIAPHNTPLSRMRAGNRDQAIIDQQAALFAKGFGYLEQYMGNSGFAAGDSPSLGDCALAPFIIMLKRTVFANFEEVTDPTAGSGRLADWWQALQSHPDCKKNIDEIDVALEAFLKWLYDMLAKREQS